MFARKAVFAVVASAVVGLATLVSTQADAEPAAQQGGGHNRLRPHQQRPHLSRLPRPDHNRPKQRTQSTIQSTHHAPASFCRRHPGHPQCRQQTKNQPSKVPTSFCLRHPGHPQCRPGQQTGGQQGGGSAILSICRKRPNHPICRPGKQTDNQPSSACHLRPWLPRCRDQITTQPGKGAPTFCQKHPNDRACFVICRQRPHLCRPEPGNITDSRPGFCHRHPHHPRCRGQHAGFFCDRHPHHSFCRPRPSYVAYPVATPAVPAPVLTAPVTYPAAPSQPAASNCTCLVKEYLRDGGILFRDVCTKEAAVSPPPPSAETPPAPVASAPAVRAPVAYPAAPSQPAASNCTCLAKEYLPEGGVLFRDVCTNEAAVSPPPQSAESPPAQ
jgi:hypothetical protein